MEKMNEVALLQQEIESLKVDMEAQKMQIAKLEAIIKYYEERLFMAKRRQFGASSEQSPGQLSMENFFNEAEDQADPTAPEPVFEEIKYTRKKRAGKREDDLSRLSVERVHYELPESERVCPECGTTMHDIGINVRREFVIIPARAVLKEHATHTYGCANCEKNSDHTPIIQAEAPAPLISGSLASPSAVAHIAVQKYISGVPLYRQEKGFVYDGVVLSRQTMSNWLIYCTQHYLSAIYSLLVAYLLKETVIHADETTVQVLHEPGRTAQNKSYEWLYCTSGFSEHKIAIYEYQETRKQDHPKAFFKDFKGYVHTDGYQAYHNLPSDIIVVGCLAHVRRYWVNVYESIAEDKRNGSNAERGLVYCNLMFLFEDEFCELTPKERYKKRLEFSKPVSDDFFTWVGSLNALPKSLLGEAVHYTLSQRKYLENFFLDGRLELSNNRAERCAKPFAQGRKQWLFSCTPNGAESSSIIYSLLETAKINNLNPFQYLKFLLEMLPSAKTSDLESLLPWSEAIPDSCHAPVKKDIPKKRKKDKGPLHLALVRLREKYRNQGVEHS